MKSTLLTILLFAIIPLTGISQFRKYSNEFLNIGAGARGLAMGSAQAASVNDATAGYWNPAALTKVQDSMSLALMYASYFGNIANYQYAGFARPLQGKKRTIGVSMLRFAVDDIPNTLYLVQPDGSLNYNNVSSFSSADYAFLFSYAQKLKEKGDLKTSIGLNAKVIYRQVGHFANAWGFGLDAAFAVQKGRWNAAIVAKDITTTFNAWFFHFDEKEKEVLYLTNNDIPVKSTELTAPRLTLASSYNIPVSKGFNLLAEADLDFTFDGKRNTLISGDPISIDPHFGLEANIKNVFFVRAGINNFQKGLKDGDTLNQKKVWIYQPGLGAGFKVNNLHIDYAFTNLANQSNPLYTHVFSLKFDL